MIRIARISAIATIAALLLTSPALAAEDTPSADRDWLDGFTLVILDTDGISAIHEARAHIQDAGGQVAIMSEPNILMGPVLPFPLIGVSRGETEEYAEEDGQNRTPSRAPTCGSGIP